MLEPDPGRSWNQAFLYRGTSYDATRHADGRWSITGGAFDVEGRTLVDALDALFGAPARNTELMQLVVTLLALQHDEIRHPPQ